MLVQNDRTTPENHRFGQNAARIWCTGSRRWDQDSFYHKPAFLEGELGPDRMWVCFECAERRWFEERKKYNLACPICASPAVQHPIDMMIECRFCGPVWKWSFWDGCSCGSDQKNQWCRENGQDPCYVHGDECEKSEERARLKFEEEERQRRALEYLKKSEKEKPGSFGSVKITDVVTT